MVYFFLGTISQNQPKCHDCLDDLALISFGKHWTVRNKLGGPQDCGFLGEGTIARNKIFHGSNLVIHFLGLGAGQVLIFYKGPQGCHEIS